MLAEATLAPPHDSAWFSRLSVFTRTLKGEIVATMQGIPSPVVFGMDGRFQKVLMRTGDGPREIGKNGSAFLRAGSDGTLRVLDIAKGGAHVFGADFQYRRMDREVEYNAASGFITRSGMIVFARSFASTKLAGLPIHVADDTGRIVRSFGGDPTLDPKASPDDLGSKLLRKVTPGDKETFWSINPTEFSLERWTMLGVRLVRVQHALDGWYEELSRGRAPPLPKGKPISEVLVSSIPNLIWLLYYVPTVTSTDPSFYDPRQPQSATGVDLIVEAVDTRSWSVLAMRRFKDVAIRPISNAPDRMAVAVQLGDTLTTYRISRLSLVRP